MIFFHKIMFYQSKSLIFQLRKFQYLHFKNLNKLEPIWVQMVYDIAVSRRFHMFGKNSKIDWPLNQLISLHKLTQLLTNQLKIGFLFDIYALNLFQLDNANISMTHLPTLAHFYTTCQVYMQVNYSLINEKLKFTKPSPD